MLHAVSIFRQFISNVALPLTTFYLYFELGESRDVPVQDMCCGRHRLPFFSQRNSFIIVFSLGFFTLLYRPIHFIVKRPIRCDQMLHFRTIITSFENRAGFGMRSHRIMESTRCDSVLKSSRSGEIRSDFQK